MSWLLPYLLAFFMLATLVVLFVGIIGFAAQGRFHAAHSNRLMRARVILQLIAVALFGLIVLLGGF